MYDLGDEMCACGGGRKRPANIQNASSSSTNVQTTDNAAPIDNRRRNAGMTSASIIAALRNANSR